MKKTRNVILCRNNDFFRAVMIQNEDGKVIKIKPDDMTQRQSILKRLLTPGEQNSGFRGLKIVSVLVFFWFFLNFLSRCFVRCIGICVMVM